MPTREYKIYRVENKINGSCYIGKTIRTMSVRKSRHLYDAKTNAYNSRFHKALIKYGFDNFEWTIIHIAKDFNELNELEIYYIKKYRETIDMYNISNGGEGVIGITITKATRKKLSEAWHRNPRMIKGFKGKNNPRYGKEVNKETRDKISKANMGKKGWNKGVPCREETKQKLRDRSPEKRGSGWTGKTRVFSEEHKQKLSEAAKRPRPWMLKENRVSLNV